MSWPPFTRGVSTGLHGSELRSAEDVVGCVPSMSADLQRFVHRLRVRVAFLRGAEQARGAFVRFRGQRCAAVGAQSGVGRAPASDGGCGGVDEQGHVKITGT